MRLLPLPRTRVLDQDPLEVVQRMLCMCVSAVVVKSLLNKMTPEAYLDPALIPKSWALGLSGAGHMGPFPLKLDSCVCVSVLVCLCAQPGWPW